MNATRAIDASHELNDWILCCLGDLEFPRSNRELLAALCFDMVIEHHGAAALLLKHNVNGTAFALPRLILDTFVRGCWLLHCATGKQIADYRNDEHQPQFRILLEQLEEKPGFRDKVLSRLKNNTWAAMNSYAHSGMLQLSRRVRSNEITPSYDDEEKIEVLKFCGTFSLMAFQHMAYLAGRNDLAEQAVNLLTEGGPLK